MVFLFKNEQSIGGDGYGYPRDLRARTRLSCLLKTWIVLSVMPFHTLEIPKKRFVPSFFSLCHFRHSSQ